jgi:hypothetical protein
VRRFITAGTCLPNCCLETSLVYSPTSRSSHSNGSTHYDVIITFLMHSELLSVYIRSTARLGSEGTSALNAAGRTCSPADCLTPSSLRDLPWEQDRCTEPSIRFIILRFVAYNFRAKTKFPSLVLCYYSNTVIRSVSLLSGQHSCFVLAEVQGSSPGPQKGYHDWISSWYYSDTSDKWQERTSGKPKTISVNFDSNSLLTDHPIIWRSIISDIEIVVKINQE